MHGMETPRPTCSTAKNFVAGQAGRSVSIFIGGFGNNITKPAETTATEFVVIEDVACTPTLPATAAAGGTQQLLVN